jgi:hypothetical protein
MRPKAIPRDTAMIHLLCRVVHLSNMIIDLLAVVQLADTDCQNAQHLGKLSLMVIGRRILQIPDQGLHILPDTIGLCPPEIVPAIVICVGRDPIFPNPAMKRGELVEVTRPFVLF